ncbi:hypothetical protein MGA3_05465 [Bacillus methanolicus MGA3]|uniref:Uncharacterized protein n=1 Tax=Bacillus methanolicus (strain MGA3 / ATCC 53907) TaxID=796606 RepID=I3E837_BACMM|nr:hypothetical protein BMMGA3_07635 [Bacillus methanolicus MGA3]EIJ82658.1 hypothetical protein MGA3_05465 [Bacillus methanolicus MGA3]
MFKMTGSAHKVLSEVIQQEKQHEQEELYVRLTMGIG